MHGAAQRLILARGTEYTVQNAAGGGGRDVPNYGDDGTLTAVVEQRSMPRTFSKSEGTEIDADLELRAVVESGTTIREAGESGGYPTTLVGPSKTYRVVHRHPEDSGVTVLTVTEDED